MRMRPGVMMVGAVGVLAFGISTWAADEKAKPEAVKGPAVTHAVAVVNPSSGSEVRGLLVFTASADGVSVSGGLSNLAPGSHGFHIHEFGDCSQADASSAGGHFNPAGHPHAGPKETQRHVGDLGNIVAGADGMAKVEIKDAKLALVGAHGIVGRAVIVHAKADDLKTQPTGDAGGRLACGVVGYAKTP
jgi:superoxide dismutase, Cu-Zn family